MDARTVAAGALGLAAWSLIWSAGLGQEKAGTTIEPAWAHTNLFAAKDADTTREVEFPLVVRAPRGFKGHVAWSFAIGNATIQAREVPLAATAEGPTRLTLSLRVPYVRPGLVMKGKLAVELVGEGEGQRQRVAHHEQPLWIFPPEPFLMRLGWLKDLKIVLFDPKETTAPILKKMEIPFEESANVAALGDVKSGLILVGEGISFEDEPELAATLVKAAARSVPVLCLAPARGVLPLPDAEGGPMPTPRGVSFKRDEVITQLDKRLDARGWRPDGKVIASTLTIKAIEGSVAAEVTHGTSGWPWLEVSYPNDTRVVVCGFGIMSHWDASPTPRYLLARMLESLTNKSGSE